MTSELETHYKSYTDVIALFTVASHEVRIYTDALNAANLHNSQVSYHPMSYLRNHNKSTLFVSCRFISDIFCNDKSSQISTLKPM